MAKHAKHAKNSSEAKEISRASVTVASEASGRHERVSSDAKATGHSPDFVNPAAEVHRLKSRRMRIVLTIVSVVLVLLIVALVYFAFTLINEASNAAVQNATTADSSDSESVASDTGTATSDTHGDIPDLVSLLGMSVDDAVEQVGRGATVTSETDITEDPDDEDSEVTGHNVTVALADETTDTSGNTPTLYFETNENDEIVSVGYSTPVSSLDYGDVSFEDIVQEDYIVENLLTDAGLPVDAGTVTLPSTDDYRTYDDDGETIMEESYTFSGTAADTDGNDHDWTCRLSYDYSSANISGDLSDTIKLVQLFVYSS